MKRLWERIKAATRKAVAKVKGWFVSLLVMLGVITAGVVMAQPRNFSWVNPTQNADGTAFNAATDLRETRIYCGGDPAVFVPEKPGAAQAWTPTKVAAGAVQTATSDFLPGDYSCFATAVSKFGYESDPSNVVTFTITPTIAPAPPTGFTVSE